MEPAVVTEITAYGRSTGPELRLNGGRRANGELPAENPERQIDELATGLWLCALPANHTPGFIPEQLQGGKTSGERKGSWNPERRIFSPFHALVCH